MSADILAADGAKAPETAPRGAAPLLASWMTPVRVALFLWVIAEVAIFIGQWPAIVALRLGDTDDAMRMAQVRDLLGGQGWYDLTQHRLNPPAGTEIHWSRLVDAPIAGLILLLRPFFGASADIWAAWAWPLILLFVLLAGSAHLRIRLLGKEALLPSVVLPVISATLMFQFALDPEEEARQVAQRVTADGRMRGLLLLPNNEWGRRVFKAFDTELKTLVMTFWDFRAFVKGDAEVAWKLLEHVGSLLHDRN